MSIYVKDDMVLLDFGSVATSQDCCCGGVCCQCDGVCDDTTTQEECEANGYKWLAGAACDDDPAPCVTGACCDDVDCSIKTEQCCDHDGKIYKGDDVPCDPNPCLPPCACPQFSDPNLPGRSFQNVRQEECRREPVSPLSTVYLAAWAELDACSGCTSHGGPDGTSLDCGGEATVNCVALDCSFFCSDGHFHGGGGVCIDEPVVTVEVIGTTVTYTSICNNGLGSTDELIIKYIFSNECSL